MTFNHYAKIKKILNKYPNEWVIKLINEPTTAKKYNGESVEFDHYYRIYDSDDAPYKYCKFQKIDKLASVLGKSVDELPIVVHRGDGRG